MNIKVPGSNGVTKSDISTNRKDQEENYVTVTKPNNLLESYSLVMYVSFWAIHCVLFNFAFNCLDKRFYISFWQLLL